MRSEEGVRTLCKIPDGAVPLDVIEVCGYLSADGGRQYTARFSGDAPLSTLLGLLRLGEHLILRDSDGEEAGGGG